jgi:hypothetical protein
MFSDTEIDELYGDKDTFTIDKIIHPLATGKGYRDNDIPHLEQQSSAARHSHELHRRSVSLYSNGLSWPSIQARQALGYFEGQSYLEQMT